MLDMSLRILPAGEVTLHDARRSRRWSVRIASFEIAAVPVTRRLFSSVLGGPAGDAQPMTSVTWHDAVRFCNHASARAGLAPAYGIDGESVEWDTAAPGYRLPTEAEWEYACRAGTDGPHYAPLADVAWTSADGVDSPLPVGAKEANAFGLYDTLGNVWEWCWDYLDPARYGDYRVFRGGGFADAAWSVRASTRRGGAPGMSHPDVGFRVARGGFAERGVVQGWSASADAERALVEGARPVGWTPRGA